MGSVVRSLYCHAGTVANIFVFYKQSSLPFGMLDSLISLGNSCTNESNALIPQMTVWKEFDLDFAIFCSFEMTCLFRESIAAISQVVQLI